MKLLFILFLSLWVLSASAMHQRMTVSFRYKGEAMKATFFTTVRDAAQTCEESSEYIKATDHLDHLRFKHYTDRNDMDPAEKRDLRNNFFNWENLARHDEIMIIHRGPPPTALTDSNFLPLGIGSEIVAMIAIDRLGNTFLDCLPGYDLLTYEELLLEKRLGIKIARPFPAPYISNFMPQGIFKHWDPVLGQHYFQHQNLVYGDIIQANALFAQEGTWPLVHSLANGYGLFSTGRIIPRGKKRVVGGITFEGPRVFVPTMVVWEVFNKRKDGVIKKAARTKYYELSGARPLMVDGVYEWKDPRLNFGNYVQVMHKTGDEFRFGWTEQFAKRDNFIFVRDVKIESTVFETMAGKELVSTLVPTWAEEITHHPRDLDACIGNLLTARQYPVTQVTYTIPITITVELGQPTIQYHPPPK